METKTIYDDFCKRYYNTNDFLVINSSLGGEVLQVGEDSYDSIDVEYALQNKVNLSVLKDYQRFLDGITENDQDLNGINLKVFHKAYILANMIRGELGIDVGYDGDLNFKYHGENIIVLRSTFDQLIDRVEFKKYISDIKNLVSMKNRTGINDCEACGVCESYKTQECLLDRLNVIAMHKYGEYLSEDTIVTIFNELTEDDIIKDWIKSGRETISSKRKDLKDYLKDKRQEAENNITELLTGIKNLFR